MKRLPLHIVLLLALAGSLLLGACGSAPQDPEPTAATWDAARWDSATWAR